MIDTTNVPDAVCSFCEGQAGVIYGPDPYIAGLYNFPSGPHPLLDALYTDYPENEWWCKQCYDRLYSNVLSDTAQLGDVMVSNLDASKPVSGEGLELLGWELDDDGFYCFGGCGLRHSPHLSWWGIDNHGLPEQLYPRTLAEVKWLMNRMTEVTSVTK